MRLNLYSFLVITLISFSCKSNKNINIHSHLEISQLSKHTVQIEPDSIKFGERKEEIFIASKVLSIETVSQKTFSLQLCKKIQDEKTTNINQTQIKIKKNYQLIIGEIPAVSYYKLNTCQESRFQHKAKSINKLSVLSFAVGLLALAIAIVWPMSIIPLFGLILSSILALFSIYQISKSKGKQKGIGISVLSLVLAVISAVFIIIDSLIIN